MAGNIKVGGNTIFTHTGAVGAGTVTLKDQSGNAILTDDGTTVAIGNVDTATVGSNALVVDASGNVGIGTSSPTYPLDIASSSDGIRLGSNVAGYRIFREPTGGNAGFLQFYGSQSNYTGYIFSGVDGERMRIDSSGHVIIPNGVTLGTAAGTYNAANTLDDYEEGTWTPLGNNVTFIDVGGSYLKIGNLVHVEGYVFFPTTSDTNYAKIQNFPFEIVGYGGLAIGLEGFSGGQISILCEPGSYTVTFREAGLKTNADLSGGAFFFGGTYITS